MRRARERRNEADDDDEDDDDDLSVSGTSVVAPEFRDNDAAAPDGWKAGLRFQVSCLAIQQRRGVTVTISIQYGETMNDERVIIFDRDKDAEEFVSVLEKEIAHEEKRVQRKVQMAMGMSSQEALEPHESIRFLVEIVSASGLPIADVHTRSSDPFVVCSFHGHVLHRTDYLSRTLDPIWTVETGSLFTFETTPQALFKSNGLECVVYDYDLAGSNDKLGVAIVPPKDIFDGNSKRLEYDIVRVAGETQSSSRGILAVRVRRASATDLQFMAKLAESRKKKALTISPARKKAVLVHEEASSSQGGASTLKSIVARRSRPSEQDKNIAEVRAQSINEQEEGSAYNAISTV